MRSQEWDTNVTVQTVSVLTRGRETRDPSACTEERSHREQSSWDGWNSNLGSLAGPWRASQGDSQTDYQREESYMDRKCVRRGWQGF